MSEPPRDLVLLVNGRSRSGARSASEARAALESVGFTVRDFRITGKRREFERVLDDHLAQAAPLIAIGGGDGTQRLAAERIAGSSSVMAVIPLGTGNAWATDLGIPPGTQRMARALASATVEPIDMGMANGRGFVNVATIGLTALIVKYLPRRMKSHWGRVAYLPAVLRSLRELRPFALEVTVERVGYSGSALLFVAAAGRAHAGPFRVSRTSSNSDGMLSLYALDETDRVGLVRFGFGLLTGRHTLLDEVWSCDAAWAKVTSLPQKRIIVDGEPLGRTPLDLEIRGQVLRVLVPGDPTVTD
ncbi:MAG: hypothetical protein KIS66_11245 [Fimbriimonadaceae bacterium]|nr:hypothetical protein [Fimbriimonadaceae bacterium]